MSYGHINIIIIIQINTVQPQEVILMTISHAAKLFEGIQLLSPVHASFLCIQHT